MNVNVATVAFMLVALGAQAQALRDPTRPPGDSGLTVQGEEAAPAAANRLQSVLISSGRRIAVISGQAVPLGGMFGEARVVKITETEVVLKKGEETEVLRMFPEVDKETVKRGAARNAQLRRREGTADKMPLQEGKK